MFIFRNLFTYHMMYVIAVFLFSVADQYQQVTILQQCEFLCPYAAARQFFYVVWNNRCAESCFIQVHCRVINSSVLYTHKSQDKKFVYLCIHTYSYLQQS